MDIILWIAASLLALGFLASGSVKFVKSRDELVASYAWVEDYSQGQVRLIGSAEVLGAVGLVAPPALGVLSVLSPIAASGLALLMIGALAVHRRRGETDKIAVVLMLLVPTAALAVLRFGPYAF